MTVFRAATLGTFFFAFHAGAKELSSFALKTGPSTLFPGPKVVKKEKLGKKECSIVCSRAKRSVQESSDQSCCAKDS